MTREPNFYKILYQTKFRVNNTKINQIFGVPIGNVKMTRKDTVLPRSTTGKISLKVI